MIRLDWGKPNNLLILIDNQYGHWLIKTYLMLCFSATSALPNSSLILLRTNVTVTVTIAPAVTTFVFSSSITIPMNKKNHIR